jgi:hypothetical protein
LNNGWSFSIFTQFEKCSKGARENNNQCNSGPKQELEVTRDIFHLARVPNILCGIAGAGIALAIDHCAT